MTYQPAVYRKQGGDELVVASSGTLTVESGGKVDLQSGSTLTVDCVAALSAAATIASGGSVTVQSGGTLNVDSGGTLSLDSGAIFYESVQTLGTSQTATAITNSGFTLLTATTTGPRYVLTAPTAIGQAKDIAISCSSSGATYRAEVLAGTTAGTFGAMDQGNTLNLSSSTAHAVRLRAGGAANWQIVGFFPVAPALDNKTT